MPGFTCARESGLRGLATISASSAEGAASAVPMAAPAPVG